MIENAQAQPPRRRLRRFLRWALFVVGAVLLLVGGGLAFWLRGALYHRLVQFPAEATAWAAIRADRQPVTEVSGWNEFRGIIHSHSELSHDCEVPFPEILRVMQETGRDFICLSDHCDKGVADFSVQWRGIHEGKLFIPGFEMKEGIMPFGVSAGTVLRNEDPTRQLISEIVAHGGIFFFAHPEEDRDWACLEATGMEIYNIHADFKDTGDGFSALLPDLLVNYRRYPDHMMRLIFDRPIQNLRRWDECNRTRHFTGIAGNDCHQNAGLRGFYTDLGTLRIEDTSPETLREIPLNAVTRFLARLCFGRLQPGKMLFHFQLDPYERMTRFVTTHVLARRLDEASILDALKAGRAFVGFDLVADSSGFLWWAEGKTGRAVMGEAFWFSPEVTLRAASPHLCRFTVVKDGTVVHQEEGRTVEWKPSGPGKYRVEAELWIRGEWTPWVYANPIELI
ncbi:MAG TPA: hypothetical protein P5186_23220 [Candidatus Paceibacterota bacterium]|nr:hypothetical protein [Verrucomicrobiota bacterium]HRY50969.1 hypothetical protein [Candidatus Paceibacterota bacterium]